MTGMPCAGGYLRGRPPATIAEDELPRRGIGPGIVGIRNRRDVTVDDDLRPPGTDDPDARGLERGVDRGEPCEVVERPDGGRDQADRAALVRGERVRRGEPRAADGFGPVDRRPLTGGHATDQEAGVPAPRIRDRRDPAGEVEEV